MRSRGLAVARSRGRRTPRPRNPETPLLLHFHLLLFGQLLDPFVLALDVARAIVIEHARHRGSVRGDGELELVRDFGLLLEAALRLRCRARQLEDRAVEPPRVKLEGAA